MLPSIPYAPFDVSEVYRRLEARSAAKARRRAARSGMRELASLDAHLLRDIGLTPDDIPEATRFGRR